MAHEDREETYKAFHEAVNMSAGTLEAFLDTEESQRVGWKGEDGHGSGESVGHKEGKRIVAILRKKKAELDDEDYADMRKVVGYVHRHLAQGGPAEGKETSAWRYSLMNWGYDPCR